MKTFFSTSLLLSLIFLASCGGNKDEMRAEDLLKVLPGTWVGIQEDVQFVESWKKSGDEALIGKGYGIAGPDTFFTENLKIEQLEKNWYYIDDPEGKCPVHFHLNQVEGRVFTFENEKHEFPRQIIYSFRGKDSILVQLLGMRDGQNAVEQIFFKREN